MSRRLSEAHPTDGTVTLPPSTEITALIAEIQRCSETVSSHAITMKARLRDLVTTFETGEPKKREKTFGQRFFGWMKKFFCIVTLDLGILATVCKFILPPAAPALALFSSLSGMLTVAAFACEGAPALSRR